MYYPEFVFIEKKYDINILYSFACIVHIYIYILYGSTSVVKDVLYVLYDVLINPKHRWSWRHSDRTEWPWLPSSSRPPPALHVYYTEAQ